MQGLKEETVIETRFANSKHDARNGDSTEGLTKCDKGAGSLQHESTLTATVSKDGPNEFIFELTSKDEQG